MMHGQARISVHDKLGSFNEDDNKHHFDQEVNTGLYIRKLTATGSYSGALQAYSPGAKIGGLKGCVVRNSRSNNRDDMMKMTNNHPWRPKLKSQVHQPKLVVNMVCFTWKQIRLGFLSLASRLVEARRGWCTWHHRGGHVKVKQKTIGSMASVAA
jgi:hypothetical protein